MQRIEKIKSEIANMSVDEFVKVFYPSDGMKQYICGEIRHPQAHCTKNDDYSCVECIKEYLRGEAV